MTDHHNEHAPSEDDVPEESTVAEVLKRGKGETPPTAAPEAEESKDSDESWPQSGFGSFP
ncbi:MAG: hypothetical protein U1E52_02840 [Geminicoccaceae bacterium]